jgi:hypothetical protein
MLGTLLLLGQVRDGIWMTHEKADASRFILEVVLGFEPSSPLGTQSSTCRSVYSVRRDLIKSVEVFLCFYAIDIKYEVGGP